MKRIFFLVFIIAIFIQISEAKTWYSVSGTLARIEYQSPNKQLADSLLHIAENALPRLAHMHGLPLSKLQKENVRIILTDVPDISNGMALGNSVVIYAMSSMYMTNWTGTEPWYKTVLTHELAHYVTFIKIRRKLNLLGQAANISVPRWFFEGIAQYFAENWNAYRGDLYIQNALLAGKLNYNSLENLEDGRLLYASGHAFIRYLATEFGDSSLIRLMSYKDNGWYLDFEDAFKSVYKKTPKDKFTDFIRQMVLHYGSRLADYPELDMLNPLPEVGYQDYQMLPLSVADSTWLISTRLDKNHLYKTALIVKQQNDAFEIIDIIDNNYTTDIVLSDDKNSAAFGRYHFHSAENQLQVRTDWYVYNFQNRQTGKVATNVRVRSAAFTADNQLVLAETFPSETHFVQYDLTGHKKILLRTKNPVGAFIIRKDGSIIAGVQQKNGRRDIIHFKNGQETPLTNDWTDDRSPVLLNDSLLVFNRYENGHPAIALINIKTKQQKLLFLDRHPYFLNGKGLSDSLIIVYRWQSNRENRFFSLNIDSLLKHSAYKNPQNRHPELAEWTKKSPHFQDSPDSTIKSQKEKTVYLPQFPMEHLLSFALPTQEPGYGWGIYGATIWIEALQRQTVAAVFLLFKDYNKSLLTVQHTLNTFNGQLLSTYYHGPVIFGFENGKYLELQQDIIAGEWYKKFYLGGNPRLQIGTSISYAHYNYISLKESLDPFKFHGPSLKAQFSYLLPTRHYPALSKRQVSVNAEYFKSLENKYDFSILGLSLKLGTNLYWEEFGFKTHTVYLQQKGKLPPYKTVGVDRFYEFDLPRDYIFSRPIRGLRQDISGTELIWNSTEFVYLIDDRTNYKLIFLPIYNLALQVFFDYAQIKNKKIESVYSYGSELSFGESILRMGIGYAVVSDSEQKKMEKVYWRLSLILP